MGAALGGCDALPVAPSTTATVPYACRGDADCAEGTCRAELGHCVQAVRSPVPVLLEVTPAASDPIYGGARFVGLLDRFDGSAEPLAVAVPPRVQLEGQINCRSSQSTLPVSVTFSPRERLIGLPLSSYELRSTPTVRRGQVAHVFKGALPPGTYDIYVVPDESAALPDGCDAVPQLFRNQPIDANKPGIDLELAQPRDLRLSVPWKPHLADWSVDIIHGVTGERISNRLRLRAPEADSSVVEVALKYTSVGEQDYYPEAGRELVRLSPPEGVAAPVVLLERTALELLTPGEGVIDTPPGAATAVTFKAWVSGITTAPSLADAGPDESEQAFATSATFSGSAQFTALELSALPRGVLAALFTRDVSFADGRELSAELLPGVYRVRVYPSPGSPFAAFEESVRVWEPEAGRIQAGRVLSVPGAGSVSGTLLSTESAAIAGVEVAAVPSLLTRSVCQLSPERRLPNSCTPQRSNLLKSALGEDQFLARARSTRSDRTGAFSLDPLDCWRCEAGGDFGALIDLSIRPEPSTGLAWLTELGLSVTGKPLTDTQYTMPLPLAQTLNLRFGSFPLSDALVRAYLLVDETGRPIRDWPLPPFCLSEPQSSSCVLSSVLVAQGWSSSSGEVSLLLGEVRSAPASR